MCDYNHHFALSLSLSLPPVVTCNVCNDRVEVDNQSCFDSPNSHKENRSLSIIYNDGLRYLLLFSCVDLTESMSFTFR